MNSFIFILLLVFAAFGVRADGLEKEPTSVFGLKLGEPLAASEIPICPPSTNRYRAEFICIEKSTGPYEDTIARLYNIPFNDTFLPTIGLQDGLVSSLHITFRHEIYQKYKDILIQRYGLPTKKSTSEVRTGMGVLLSSETLEWRWQKNTLHLFQRFDTVDRSLIAFTNIETSRLASLKKAAEIKESAAKF